MKAEFKRLYSDISGTTLNEGTSHCYTPSSKCSRGTRMKAEFKRLYSDSSGTTPNEGTSHCYTQVQSVLEGLE